MALPHGAKDDVTVVRALLKIAKNSPRKKLRFAVVARGKMDGDLIVAKKTRLRRSVIEKHMKAEDAAAKKKGLKPAKYDVIVGECQVQAPGSETLRVTTVGKTPARAVSCMDYLVRKTYKGAGFKGITLIETPEVDDKTAVDSGLKESDQLLSSIENPGDAVRSLLAQAKQQAGAGDLDRADDLLSDIRAALELERRIDAALKAMAGLSVDSEDVVKQLTQQLTQSRSLINDSIGLSEKARDAVQRKLDAEADSLEEQADEKSDAADQLITQVENELAKLSGTVPDAPPAPPPAPPPSTDPDREQQWKQRHSELQSDLKQTLKDNPQALNDAARDRLLKLLTKSQQLFNGQSYDQADTAHQAVAQSLEAAKSMPTTESGKDQAAEFATWKTKLEPELLKAQKHDREQATRLGSVWDYALTQADSGEYSKATQAFGRLEKLIEEILSKESPAVVEAGIVEKRKFMITRMQELPAEIRPELKTLRDKIVEDSPDEDADQIVDAVRDDLEVLFRILRDELDQAINAGDSKMLKGVRDRVLKNELVSHLAKSTLMDGTSFQKAVIKALDEVETHLAG